MLIDFWAVRLLIVSLVVPVIILTTSSAVAEMDNPAAPAIVSAWISKNTVRIRITALLDGGSDVLTLKIGEAVTFRNVTVTADACVQTMEDYPKDSAAFLRISEDRLNGADFKGWVFSAEPGLGGLESPVYNVQVLSCFGQVIPLPPIASSS